MSGSLLINNETFDYELYSKDFMILKGRSHQSLAQIGLTILNQKYAFITEVIATEQEILLKLNTEFSEEKLTILSDLRIEKDNQNRNITLPVLFNNSLDWESVISHSKLSRENYIDEIVKTKFTLAMFGFLPGFAYMNGLDPALCIPRKTTPSKYVSANSVAVGGKYFGIYSVPSPGGWSVIGSTPVTVLDTNGSPPILLKLNDQITIEKINEAKYKDIQASDHNILSYNGLT